MKLINHVGQLKTNKTSFGRLVEDIENYLEHKFKIYNNPDMFNSAHWKNLLRDITMIIDNYYNIENVNSNFYDMSRIEYNGGFVGLPDKYKDKYVKDIYEIGIKSAYPQRINNLIESNKLQFSDKYLKYIFHLLYKHVKASTLRRLFINYTYGIVTSIKSDIRSNLDLRLEVSEYYNKLLRTIHDYVDYVYMDTDCVYVTKDNIENVLRILDADDIEYDVDYKPYDYLLFNKKKYVKFENYKIIKTVGIRQNINDKYFI